jgi:hypothetical protein
MRIEQLSRAYCLERLPDICLHLQHPPKPAIQHVELRTCTEGLASADYFIYPKSSFQGDVFAVFIALLYCFVNWLEFDEWITHPPDDIDRFLECYFLPALYSFEFADISLEQLRQELNGIPRSICQYLDDQANYDKPFSGYQRGFLINGDRLPYEQRHTFEPPMNAISGVALKFQWNDMRLFYETPDAYVFYHWSTGA